MSFTVSRSYRAANSDEIERERLTVTKDQLGPTMWMMGVPEHLISQAVRLASEGTVDHIAATGRTIVTWREDGQ